LLYALSGQPSFFDATLVCILRAPEKLPNEFPEPCDTY